LAGHSEHVPIPKAESYIEYQSTALDHDEMRFISKHSATSRSPWI